MAAVDWEDEVEGWFWKPARSPTLIRGRLVTSWSDGAELQLEEGLGEYREKEFARVYGQDMAGRPMALIDLFSRNRILGTSLPERFHHRLTVGQALLGTDRPLTRFPGATAWFAGLSDFMVGSGVEYDPKTGSVLWNPRPRKVWTVAEDLRIEFMHQRELDGGARSVRMRDGLRLALRSRKGRLAEDWQEVVHRLNVFLGFCISRPAEFERLILSTHAGAQVENRYGLREIRGADHGQPWMREWDFPDLGASLSEWFRYCEESPEAVGMLTEFVAFGGHLNLADRLLLLARFLEVHHRRHLRSGELSRADHKRRVREVTDSAPEPLRPWVKGALDGANSLRLQERLVELCKVTRFPREVLHGSREGFATGVTKTRNYYTHYSANEKRKAADGMALAVMVKRVWLLVRSCVLQEIGFSASDATEAIRRDREWVWLGEQPPFVPSRSG
jgi:hypothetical protein